MAEKNIITVLRSGGDFVPNHVNRLYMQCLKYCSEPFDFFCLTDIKNAGFFIGVKKIYLKNNWPGWWSKIELFRDDLYLSGKVVYMDLDTTLINSIDFLFDKSPLFAVLAPLNPNREDMCSGLMSWKYTPPTHIYYEFEKNASPLMTRFFRKGDQGFIWESLCKTKTSVDFFQDLFPGKIRSYKLSKGVIKKDCAIVLFHGWPRPWELDKEITIE